MKRLLIWMFYLFLLLTTILRTIEFGASIIFPDEDIKDTSIALKIFYVNYAALQASFFVELTLILTIFTLFISLKLILNEISIERVKKQE